MKFPQVKTKSVLITGCSSGIGLASAILLRDNGWQVAPTARKDEDLRRLRELGFDPISLDLNDSASIRSGVEMVLRRFNGHLGALVNNAGYGQPGAMEDLSRDAMRAQFETNLFGLQELTNRILPVMRRQGFGRIVNVSSVVARIALPFMGIYSASKFAVEAVSDVLRVELSGSGIAVSLVEPGPIATDFSKRSLSQAERELNQEASAFGVLYQRHIMRRKAGDRPQDLFRLPPEAVAAKVLRALTSRRPATRYKVTLPAYVGALADRLLPDAFIDFLMCMRLKQLRKSAEIEVGARSHSQPGGSLS